MNSLNQKREQFKVNIRKQKIDQIFKSRRRQIVLSNAKTIYQQDIQLFNQKIQSFRTQIANAELIMKQAVESYDFQHCLQGLRATLFILQQYNSKVFYKQFKKLSQMVIQTQITDNMFKMLQLSIDCQKQRPLIQIIDQYTLKITQMLICNQNYSMEMIKKQRISQQMLTMLRKSSRTVSNSNKVAFILANSLIGNGQLAFQIRRSNHLQQMIKRMQELQYDLSDNFVISALFFTRILFEQSYKLTDMPACQQSLQFMIYKCLQIMKGAAYRTNHFEKQTVQDASWVFRYIYENCWIKPKFFIQQVNLDELAEWLSIFESDLQIQEQILKIIQNVCYRDTKGTLIRGLIKQGRLIQTIFRTKINNQTLSLSILSSIAAIKAQDNFKADLWPVLQALMVGIMQSQASPKLILLVFNWFDSQDFKILRDQDYKILGCLIQMVEVVNPQSLQLLAELWYNLVMKGYRGDIPKFLCLHSEIQYIKDLLDFIQMQQEKAKENGSSMNIQQGERFKNISNFSIEY